MQFVDDQLEAAAAYGWTQLESFAIHRTAGVARADYAGALARNTTGRIVVAVTPAGITLGGGLVHRCRLVPADAVPLSGYSLSGSPQIVTTTPELGSPSWTALGAPWAGRLKSTA